MDALPIEPGSLDAIWSEGAIYNMGFENGVRQWRRLLKPGGILAVSELTWLTASRPAELEEHWHAQYAEVGTASSKLAVLERNGYAPMGYFTLPEHCWLDAYYLPMQQRFAAFLARHESSAAAKAVVAAEELEIALYARHRAFVSYGYYLARRPIGRRRPVSADSSMNSGVDSRLPTPVRLAARAEPSAVAAIERPAAATSDFSGRGHRPAGLRAVSKPWDQAAFGQEARHRNLAISSSSSPESGSVTNRSACLNCR
jgi:hypothetical protein